jgi:ATP-binding cassette subfamily C protein LapB
MDLTDKFKLNDPECNFRIKKAEIILVSLAINLLSLALPIMVLQVYDRVMVNHTDSTLKVLSAGVIVAIILEIVLRITRTYTISWAGMIYEYTMSTNAMNRYINANPSEISNDTIGSKIQSIGSFGQLKDFYSGQILTTLADLPFALMFLLIIFYLTGELVIVPLVLIGIFCIMAWIIGNLLKLSIQTQGNIDNKRYNFILEALQGIHTIKSFGIESIMTRRHEAIEEKLSVASYNHAIISSLGYTAGVLLNELMVISTTAIGALMVINNQFTTGALITAILLSGRLMQPIQKILLLWTQFQKYRLASETVNNIFSIKQIEHISQDKAPATKGEIQINNLSFKYKDQLIFENINLSLKIPEIIAINGPSHSGKSTLMNLIVGSLPPLKGSILIDGLSSLKYSSEELINHVGYISSESNIFYGTVLENLTGFDETKIKKAMDMAKFLKLDKDIDILPQGYDTKINDGIADVITPGIKQRISIARTLINKPKIILFNNADKGLDQEGYKNVLQFLNFLKGQVSMIIITDDPNIKKLADREYILDNKCLKEITIKNAKSSSNI